MAVGLKPQDNIFPVKGVKLAAISAGIYDKPRSDLALIQLPEGCTSVGVFTKNAFCAAPVIVAKNHLASSTPNYYLINAGNANAGTGEAGLKDCQQCCTALANLTGINSAQVLPFSTGVIGEYLPTKKIFSVLPKLYSSLNENSWNNVAEAIMTTDTVAKSYSVQVNIDDEIVTITGIAKGSGMIRPDMATMLAYVATDATIEHSFLTALLEESVAKSFNRITVDGDTSTNDACMLFATGKSRAREICDDNSDRTNLFKEKLLETFIYLAQAIVRDGEGATKFVTVEVINGENEKECLKVAYTVAHSPLVKTALFASDPNWGRILAAVGRSPLENFEVSKVDIFINSLSIVKQGSLDMNYSEKKGKREMEKDEIKIIISLNRGIAKSEIWTSDLSHQYVTINAEYRT